MFTEERLELGINYGANGGPQFSTNILVLGDGSEQRNINWSQPLGRWQLGERILNNVELDYLIQFFDNRQGSFEGFRFKDWTDWKATNQSLGIGNGAKTQFQLIKTYTIASYSVRRPIVKPVAGTIKIYLNGVEQLTGWTANTTNGVITFNSPPGNGIAITANFEFDVPVRFETDKIDFQFEAIAQATGEKIFRLNNLTVKEIRVSVSLDLDSIPLSLGNFDLGYPIGTVGGANYNTTITNLSSGFEQRLANWQASKYQWNLGDRTLTQSELDYFLAFFRVARGAAVAWTYSDWATVQEFLVRFESDNINFRFDAYEKGTGKAIYYLAGLNIVALTTGTIYNYYLYYHVQTYRYGESDQAFYTRTQTPVRGILGELNNPVAIPVNELPYVEGGDIDDFTHIWHIQINGQTIRFQGQYDENLTYLGDFNAGITNKDTSPGISSVESINDFIFYQAVFTTN